MKALTPVGVARVLVRGIEANFSPENQEGELEKLVEYLESLCMAREDEIDYGDDSTLAEQDSNFLFSVIRELEKS